jgi:hypothetical protein
MSISHLTDWTQTIWAQQVCVTGTARPWLLLNGVNRGFLPLMIISGRTTRKIRKFVTASLDK